jgi:lysophospholipase L1-like esterase
MLFMGQTLGLLRLIWFGAWCNLMLIPISSIAQTQNPSGENITHPVDNNLPEQAVTTEQIVGGLKQLIARARGNHLKVFGATLLPGEGEPEFAVQAETARMAINQWIRTSHAFDGVIDFDSVVRDPEHPARLRSDYDSGDHVHPNDAGYRAMADAIDLNLFGKE